MKRRTTATIVGGAAGSAVVLGIMLAGPASACIDGFGKANHRLPECTDDQSPTDPATSPAAERTARWAYRSGAQSGPQSPFDGQLPPDSQPPSGSQSPPESQPPSSSQSSSAAQSQPGNHRRSRHQSRRCRSQRPSPSPTGSQTETPMPPSESPTDEPTGSMPPTSGPTATSTPTATATSQPTATASCATYPGSPAALTGAGVGNLTVTIEVCNGTLKSATAALSQSNYEPTNTNAIKALNQLAVQNYKTDISKVAFSGATLTSTAYRTSLKSALTKAGL